MLNSYEKASSNDKTFKKDDILYSFIKLFKFINHKPKDFEFS